MLPLPGFWPKALYTIQKMSIFFLYGFKPFVSGIVILALTSLFWTQCRSVLSVFTVRFTCGMPLLWQIDTLSEDPQCIVISSVNMRVYFVAQETQLSSFQFEAIFIAWRVRFLEDQAHVMVNNPYVSWDSLGTSTTNVGAVCNGSGFFLQICQQLGGVRVTTCKSGKDRTSMGVTLEMIQILQRHHNLAPHVFSQALDCLRRWGNSDSPQFNSILY